MRDQPGATREAVSVPHTVCSSNPASGPRTSCRPAPPFLGVCSVALKDDERFDALRRGLALPAWREGFCAPLQAPAIACAS